MYARFLTLSAELRVFPGCVASFFAASEETASGVLEAATPTLAPMEAFFPPLSPPSAFHPRIWDRAEREAPHCCIFTSSEDPHVLGGVKELCSK